MGELSLGEIAKLLEINKADFRKIMATDTNLPILDESLDETIKEANKLLNS